MYRGSRSCEDRTRCSHKPGSPVTGGKAPEARGKIPLQVSEGMWPSQHPDFRLRDSGTVTGDGGHFRCPESPRWWEFVQQPWEPGSGKRVGDQAGARPHRDPAGKEGEDSRPT